MLDYLQKFSTHNKDYVGMHGRIQIYLKLLQDFYSSAGRGIWSLGFFFNILFPSTSALWLLKWQLLCTSFIPLQMRQRLPLWNWQSFLVSQALVNFLRILSICCSARFLSIYYPENMLLLLHTLHWKNEILQPCPENKGSEDGQKEPKK